MTRHFIRMRFNNRPITHRFIDFCLSRGFHGRVTREGIWYCVWVEVPKYQRRDFTADWAEATMEVRR